jgi:hypothetical protein
MQSRFQGSIIRARPVVVRSAATAEPIDRRIFQSGSRDNAYSCKYAGVHSVSFLRPKLILKSDNPRDAADQSTRDSVRSQPTESFRSRRRRITRERDAERGYSINVKQVVLAFAVEFWIIT